MFKKFDSGEDIIGSQQLKGSVQKSIRAKLIEQFPLIEEYIEQILPKKENFKLLKCKDHLELIADVNGEIQFVKHRDLPQYFPVLRLLHKYPFFLKQQKVDKGAIRFVLNGSHIMCPGLTSPGAQLNESCSEGELVAIMGEGKENAMAIGQMKLSPTTIREKNTGIAIDNIHYLNDGLWRIISSPN
ncbi:PUA domain-containing protein [Meloidogyne graminicola]|uniref:PUA domain-containing protein n=1 Tax=Meloidogyne graminicola TaxID=189291 RepID=A0A8S9ZWK4_9BILA|nr:PUA domain-containing protein [Meloidogyne graminicola]